MHQALLVSVLFQAPCSRHKLNLYTLAANTTTAPSTTTTAGPVVAIPPPSMLRGKTLEEIVNRWTNELETNVKEFNRFAAEVAVWDRALIENGNNVSFYLTFVIYCTREREFFYPL